VTLAGTLDLVVGALDGAGVAFMVVEGSEAQLLDFAEAVARENFYVSEAAIREAVELNGQSKVIHRPTGWKVDLILRKDREFSRTEFARRTKEDTRPEERGAPSLWIATAEDMILAKLEWAKRTGSERQLRDVQGILRAQAEALDRPYIERWVRALDVVTQWQAVRDRGPDDRA